MKCELLYVDYSKYTFFVKGKHSLKFQSGLLNLKYTASLHLLHCKKVLLQRGDQIKFLHLIDRPGQSCGFSMQINIT